MDIRFTDGVFVLDNSMTLLPSTFRGYLNEDGITITHLNGDTMFKIPENNNKIEGAPATIRETFSYLIINNTA